MIATRNRDRIARAGLATIVAFLAAACAVHPTHPDDFVARIDAALAAGDTTTAVELLRTRVWSNRCSPEEYTRLARILRSRGTVIDRFSAERILAEGLRNHPDNADILLELGRTYYDQTFYGDAERIFELVLSIDPARCEAHYYLGVNEYRKWKRVQSYDEYLTTAIMHLRKAEVCADRKGDTLEMIAFSQYVLGEMTSAAETCSTSLVLYPDDPEPLQLLGTIACEDSRYGDAWRFFRQAMTLSSEDERRNYTDIALLLIGDDERQRYACASLEQRATIERLYWLEHDPDPTTEINERWLEHASRVFLADARFATTVPLRRGWETGRGKAFIKFGPPDDIHSTLEGRRPHSGRSETWVYLGHQEGFLLGFQDEYLNGNYIVPLWDDVTSEALSDAPPNSAVSAGTAPVGGALDIVTFRDSDTAASVYVTFAADDSLSEALRMWDIRRFTARTAFFDNEGRSVAYDEDTLDADSPLHDAPGRRVRTSWAKRFSLPFNSYRVSFCYEDEKRLARSLIGAEPSTLRYLGHSLVLSDILLYTPSPSAKNPFVDRGQRRFFANPRRTADPSEALHLYVEIYNLVLADRASEYEVTYSIHEADTTSSHAQRMGRTMRKLFRMAAARQAFVAQSFERAGASDVASEELAIDARALPPGDYVLVVSVADRISGARARASKSFVKPPSAVNGRGSQ